MDAIRGIGGRNTVLTCFMSARGLPEVLSAPGVRIPSFGFPGTGGDRARACRCARGLARARPWPGRPVLGHPRRRGDSGDRPCARARGDTWLEPDETAQLFDCYRLPVVQQVSADDCGGGGGRRASDWRLRRPQGNRAAAQERGRRRPPRPLSRPRSRPRRRRWPSGLWLTASRLKASSSRSSWKGTEILVGMAADPNFGPIVACGAGGVNVELTATSPFGLRPSPTSRRPR